MNTLKSIIFDCYIKCIFRANCSVLTRVNATKNFDGKIQIIVIANGKYIYLHKQ